MRQADTCVRDYAQCRGGTNRIEETNYGKRLFSSMRAPANFCDLAASPIIIGNESDALQVFDRQTVARFSAAGGKYFVFSSSLSRRVRLMR